MAVIWRKDWRPSRADVQKLAGAQARLEGGLGCGSGNGKEGSKESEKYSQALTPMNF